MQIDLAELVPIVGDGAIASRIAQGGLVPVLLLDTSMRPEVAELIRVHAHLPSGDVTARWGQIENDKDGVILLLDFERPISVRVGVRVSIEHEGIIVDSAVRAGAVYLQAGQRGDRVSDGLDKPRILVELHNTHFGPKWDQLLFRRMTEVFRARLGGSRADAAEAASEMIAKVRTLTDFRLRG